MYSYKIGWLTVLVLLCFSYASFGQYQSPYQLSLKKELLFTGGGTGTFYLGMYLRSKTPKLTLSDLDLEDINGFDRIATRQSSELADHWSDYTMYASLALPSLFLAGRETRNDLLTIAVLYGETLLINEGLTRFVKSIALRPRPYVFDEQLSPATILTSNDRASFLSGHTSASATASFFFAKVFSDYYPDSKWKPYVWGFAATLPAVTGYLRVRAGKHYPTDVLAGYALGAAVGWLVPALHKRKIDGKSEVSIFPTGAGFHLNYRF